MGKITEEKNQPVKRTDTLRSCFWSDRRALGAMTDYGPHGFQNARARDSDSTPKNLNLNGGLGGGSTVTVGSAMNWTGDSMYGSGRTIIQSGATLNIPFLPGYGGVYLYDRTLENKGSMVWGGGYFDMTGVLTNDVGALLEIQGSAAFNFYGGAPRFDNAGTFVPCGKNFKTCCLSVSISANAAIMFTRCPNSAASIQLWKNACHHGFTS
jgi:hypothetical protein